MKFNITGKTLWNEVRNYLALGFNFFAIVLSLPSLICQWLSDKLKVE